MNSAFVTKTTFAVGLTLTAGIFSPSIVQAEIPLQYHMTPFVTNHVDAGVTMDYTNDVNRTARTGILKVGEGTLKVANQDVAVLRVQAREGKVALATDTTATCDDLSSSVKNKLALWVSTKDTNPEHFYEEGENLERWYDVRETNTNSPTCRYLETLHSTNGVPMDLPSPSIVDAQWIRKYATTTNTQRMVYFKGFGSGVSMKFFNKDGSTFNTNPKELSVVYGYLNFKQTFGYLMGDCDRHDGDITLWNQENGMPWKSSWGPVNGDGKVWLDGEFYPQDTDKLPFGFHTYHTRFNTVPGNGFYFHNALFSYHCNKSSRGGEYVGEVMFFTSRLTHAERLEVMRYLNRKWFGRVPKTSVITLESGAELDVEEGDEANVEVAGDGTFKKLGEGTYVYRPETYGAESPATISFEGGAVEAARELAVRVDPGESINATGTTSGQHAITLSKGEAANEKTIVKTGKAAATIGAIPEGTVKLEVQAGKLILRPTKAAVKRYEVKIPNGDFTDWDVTKGSYYFSTSKPASGYGWKRKGTAAFCHHEYWKTVKGDLGNTSVAYGFSNTPPLEGLTYMTFKNYGDGSGATVYGVELEAGEYELSYCMMGRNANAYGGRVQSYLTDQNDQAVTHIGTAVNALTLNWENSQKTFRFSAPSNGTYAIHFEFVANFYEQPGVIIKKDVMLAFSSLHLYRIGDLALAWKIPYGDFENVYTNKPNTQMSSLLGDINYFYANEIFLPNWTFDSRVDKNKYVYSGVTTAGSYCHQGRRWGSGYNGSRAPLGGRRQGLFHYNGATMTTTFTPPKGKWFLKCQASPWLGYKDGMSIRASIAAGATTNNLGEAKLVKRFVMSPYVWPNAFEADGNTSYTLTLTMNGSNGANVDDFELVGAYEYDYELVKNGGFEYPFLESTENIDNKRDDWTLISKNCPRIYGRDEIVHFGTDHGAGDYYTEPYDKGGIYQNVTFPRAGWYRVDYLAKRRLNAGENFGFEVQLVDSVTKATNVIDHITSLGKGAFSEQSALFHVDSADTHALRLMATTNCYVCIDDVSIRYAGESGAFSTPDASANRFVVSIAKDAYLHLDFSGTNTVTRFIVNGVAKPEGVYNAANCPQIVGPGSLKVVPISTGTQVWVK